MNPFLLAGLGIAGLGGGLLGGRGRGPIDPALLARLFGPGALATDTQTLYNSLLTSPLFQQLQSRASSMGTQAGNAAQAAFARAGLSQSGIGAVNSALSSQFGNDLILRARSNLWQQAQQQAAQSLAQRAGIWGQSQLMYQGTPTLAQSFGNALTGLAGTGFTAALSGGGGQRAAAVPGVIGTSGNYGDFNAGMYPGTSVVSGPMRRLNPTQRTGMFNPWGN